MILSNVNIGTGPSVGDGDPLRTAFSTINNNFSLITSNVNRLTNSVSSVAGRTGNITLTTLDIVGISNYATVAQLANVGGTSYSNVNVAAYLPGYTGSIGTVTAANLAMKGYVDASVAGLVDSAPGTLNTLNELAAALGDDPNLSVTLTNTIVSANTTMKAYVDGQTQAANSAVTAANVGLKGYVDQANTIQNAQITAANLGMKGYVDSVAGASNYGNANVATYLENYSGNIGVGSLVFSDLSEQSTAYTGVQWRSNLESNVVVKPSWMSYYPGLKNQLGTQYGFDSGGMFFNGNADNDNAYPIRTNIHFHQNDVLEIIATINFAHTGDDPGLALVPVGVTPIWRYSTDPTRIAFQFSSGAPRLYGQLSQDVSGTPILTAGNPYTIKLVYSPGNTVTVYTHEGTGISGTLLDTRTITEVMPAGDYVIGFDADQDGVGDKSYFTNIIIRTLTNTVVNDLEIQGQVTGDLIPSANVTYSLGNVTHQWNDLFVSNNTIYIGGVPLSIDGSGNLLVNGVPVSTGSITSADTITITNANTSNVADILIQSGDDITLQAKDRLPGNDAEGGDINIYAGDGCDDNGVDGTSSAGDVTIEGGRGGAANVSSGGSGGVVAIRGGVGGSASLTASAGGGSSISLTAGDAGSNGGDPNLGNLGGDVNIRAGDSNNTSANGGIISLTPGTNVDGANRIAGYVEINIPISNIGEGGTWTFDGTGRVFNTPQNAEIFGAGAGNLTVGSSGNTFIRSLNYSSLVPYTWQFSDLGVLTLPGEGILQSLDDTVNLVSLNTTSGYANSVYLGSSGGLGFFDQSAGGNWLEIFRSGATPEITSPTGNLKITTVVTGVSSNTWTYGTDGSITFPDNTIQTTAWTGTVSGGSVTGNVAEATLAYAVNISPVLLNQEYPLAILPSTTGAYGIKSSDGTLGFTFNPARNRMIVGNIQLGADGNIRFADGTTQTTAANYGNTQVAQYLPSYSGTLSAGFITVPGTTGKIGFDSSNFAQQTTSNSTQVTSNTTCGNIQLMNINLGAHGVHTVAFACNQLTTNDVLLVKHISGGVTSVYVDAYVASNGLAVIWLRDITGSGTGNFTPMLKYFVIQAPN